MDAGTADTVVLGSGSAAFKNSMIGDSDEDEVGSDVIGGDVDRGAGVPTADVDEVGSGVHVCKICETGAMDVEEVGSEVHSCESFVAAGVADRDITDGACAVRVGAPDATAGMPDADADRCRGEGAAEASRLPADDVGSAVKVEKAALAGGISETEEEEVGSEVRDGGGSGVHVGITDDDLANDVDFDDAVLDDRLLEERFEAFEERVWVPEDEAEAKDDVVRGADTRANFLDFALDLVQVLARGLVVQQSALQSYTAGSHLRLSSLARMVWPSVVVTKA